MESRRTLSEHGFDFITAYEGLRRRAAPVGDGRWTIGYSHVADDLEGEEITPMVAKSRLAADLAPVEEAIHELVYAPLTQNQFDALVSFGFSIGVPAFRSCGVAELLNEGRPIEAAAVFDAWRHAQVGDRIICVDALVRRRAAEKALFLEVDGGPVPAPSALVRPTPPPVPAEIELAAAAFAPERARPSWGVVAGARRGIGVAASAARALLAEPARPERLPPSPEWTERWPWMLGGLGLVLVALGVTQMRAGAGADLPASAELAWTVATLSGVLALAAAAYHGARRIAGVADD